jgi:hypothetical protein
MGMQLELMGLIWIKDDTSGVAVLPKMAWRGRIAPLG